MMTTLALLTAVYNEQEEIIDLLESVRPYVDEIVISDDGSTDDTIKLIDKSGLADRVILGPHVASCEETRIRGLAFVQSEWVLILDADERVHPDDIKEIKSLLGGLKEQGFTHIYFTQDEFIDGVSTRSFQKAKLALKDCLHLPELIHGDISVDGTPANLGWRVAHRKTTNKQIRRELEYLNAYKQKVVEGKMTQEWADKVTQWHYFVKGTK